MRKEFWICLEANSPYPISRTLDSRYVGDAFYAVYERLPRAEEWEEIENTLQKQGIYMR